MTVISSIVGGALPSLCAAAWVASARLVRRATRERRERVLPFMARILATTEEGGYGYKRLRRILCNPLIRHSSRVLDFRASPPDSAVLPFARLAGVASLDRARIEAR